MKVIVFGGTGFVGRHLVQKLKENHEVTIATRNPAKVSESLLSEKVDVIEADLFNFDSLEVVKDYDVVYYLVHAMDQSENYIELEKKQALNLSSQLVKGQKVIYLSGLAHANLLSKHMHSRHEVGRVLAQGEAECIEFRASIVIGAGSLSFEMVRAVVERFPVILEAEWAKTKCCPIYIEDLVAYLEKGMDQATSEIIEIGGGEDLEYVELLKKYAQIQNLKRPILKIAQFPRSVVGNVMDIFLPEYSMVGKSLLDSITIESTVHSDSYQKFKITPRSVNFAMRESIKDSDRSWQQLSIEEILSNDKFGQVKQNFASAHLLDQYEFFIPFPKVYLTKAFDSFLKLYNINPFKKFSVLDFEQMDDTYRLNIETKVIKGYTSRISFSEIDAVTKVKIVNQYEPMGFVDASTYVAVQKFSNLVFDTIQSFLPK